MNQKKVLVVEDETALRNVLRDNLTWSGFKVIEAKDGKEGLEKALEERPDIMLLDIILPHMNGMAVMHELRKDSWGKDLPIILITNLSANQKIVDGVIEDKPVFYLEKAGWSIREVIEKVKTLAGVEEIAPAQ
jgi:two-component system alkaline phosphatase synthesis response regulator PhoP